MAGRLARMAEVEQSTERLWRAEKAEATIERVRALTTKWDQSVTSLWAANGEEAVETTRAVRAVKADAYEQCNHDLRTALATPTPTAETGDSQ